MMDPMYGEKKTMIPLDISLLVYCNVPEKRVNLYWYVGYIPRMFYTSNRLDTKIPINLEGGVKGVFFC